jgi:Ser/Thr protein kinase RdoA (MazF antagonist)
MTSPPPPDRVLEWYPDRFRSLGFSLPPDGPGFSGAAVWRVETGAGPHCLRKWPAQADPERIGALHRVLSHARSQGVDFISEPVRANDGRTLVFAHRSWWQLEPWMPGRADFAARPSEARLAAATASLARLHLAMAAFEPAGAERTWFFSDGHALAPAVAERIERLAGWSNEKIVSLRTTLERSQEISPGFNVAASAIVAGFCRCAQSVGQELRSAARLRVPVQPCLRDVWHDHILFVDDAVTGIIDPGAARSDTVAADISRLVGSLVADDARSWETAVAAYQSVRRLSTDERTLIGIVDRSGTLLSGMIWLARRFFANAPFEHPERVVGRMEKIAARLETLGAGRAARLLV